MRLEQKVSLQCLYSILAHDGYQRFLISHPSLNLRIIRLAIPFFNIVGQSLIVIEMPKVMPLYFSLGGSFFLSLFVRDFNDPRLTLEEFQEVVKHNLLQGLNGQTLIYSMRHPSLLKQRENLLEAPVQSNLYNLAISLITLGSCLYYYKFRRLKYEKSCLPYVFVIGLTSFLFMVYFMRAFIPPSSDIAQELSLC